MTTTFDNETRSVGFSSAGDRWLIDWCRSWSEQHVRMSPLRFYKLGTVEVMCECERKNSRRFCPSGTRLNFDNYQLETLFTHHTCAQNWPIPTKYLNKRFHWFNPAILYIQAVGGEWNVCPDCVSCCREVWVTAHGWGSSTVMTVSRWWTTTQTTAVASRWLPTSRELNSPSKMSSSLTRGNSSARLTGWLPGTLRARPTSEYLVRKSAKDFLSGRQTVA